MKHKTPLLLSVCTLAFCVSPAIAREQTEIQPQHIILGQAQSVYSNKTAMTMHQGKAQSRLHETTTPEITSCGSQASAPYRIKTEQLEDQINALKNYIAMQNRDPAIIDILYNVATETGTAFTILTVKALMESDLGRQTVAEHSSARGIYQYIEPTWLILMKRHGEKIGYKAESDSIKFDHKTGRIEIKSDDIGERQRILNLRDDIKTAALIKAYQIKDETAALQNMKGARITATDHYIAHMLGLNMANTFYAMKNANSPIQMASLKHQNFAEAIALNKSFFYDKNDTPLTAKQAYEQFRIKIMAQYQKLDRIHTAYRHLPSIANGKKLCKAPKTVTAVNERQPFLLPEMTTVKKQAKQVKNTTPEVKTISMNAIKTTPAEETPEHQTEQKSEKSNMELINAAIDKYRVKLKN